MNSPKVSSYAVIIPAAGESSRFGRNTNKLLFPLGNKQIPIIIHTINAFFAAFPNIYMVIPVNKQKISLFESLISEIKYKQKIYLLAGGKTRTESVFMGLEAIPDNIAEYTAIHDAARPLIKPDIIKQCFASAEKYGNTVLAKRNTDTLKYVNKDGIIIKDINRDNVFRLETPQIFKTDILKTAYKKIMTLHRSFVDDSSVIQFIGEKVYITEHRTVNLKITYPEDIKIAEKFL